MPSVPKLKPAEPQVAMNGATAGANVSQCAARTGDVTRRRQRCERHAVEEATPTGTVIPIQAEPAPPAALPAD
jgi:hypothetical protein